MKQRPVSMGIPPLSERQKFRIQQLRNMNANDLSAELDAMLQMLCMWETDIGKSDPFMACIIAMIVDMATILRHNLTTKLKED